ncbi:MAG TPA: chemotaxis response regulator protein-glutamate methylesterase [Spirochaetota bacterium]|nr:chemotaxis response regulator protein-glutamate methylesterase [Spirochaetota bacterium]HPJ33812.1 chemotaxis response regulator protein-glutamate methylesterase [Spirochaetota bacterium]
MVQNKVKVLIIDDSALMRKFLTDTLNQSSGIEVLGTAIDAAIAAKKINTLKPDVITLDIEMPGMDGLTFLQKLMIANPIPAIMVSSLTEKGSKAAIRALEIGAFDVIAKPQFDVAQSSAEFSRELIEKVIAAGHSKGRIKKKPAPSIMVEQKFSADVILSKSDFVNKNKPTEKVIAIGASTGGTEVVDQILANLPNGCPGIVITQHMPEKFTEAFANRVNGKSRLLVKEAKNGDRLLTDMALIAPGGKHMLLKSDRNGYWIEINEGPPVNRHRPSVDVLFRSVSKFAGDSAVGIICTGMGNDGAAGLLEMKQAGAFTVAQNEESCVVFGMPKEAIKLGAADMITDIEGIVNYIKKMYR